MVAYASNDIEIKNLETGEVLNSITIDYHEPLMDFDFYKDENCVLVGFRSDVCYLVNMNRKSINPFNHYLP